MKNYLLKVGWMQNAFSFLPQRTWKNLLHNIPILLEVSWVA